MSQFRKVLNMAGAVTACAVTLCAAMPSGWHLAGSKPQEYDCEVDSLNPYNGMPSVYLRSKEGIKTTGFGTLLQDFSATQYIGKRVRLSGHLKSQDVTSWGGLWMRVDDSHQTRNGSPATLAFDNMHDGLKDRSIKGTTGWQSYSVVLDVPENATAIYIGFLLDGPGTLWLSNVKVEIVGPDVPVTGRPVIRPPVDGPVNLSLTQ